ncbi:MAG: efflux RND transporter periplasmic adaptor subunit [Burkholderiales bacterium]
MKRIVKWGVTAAVGLAVLGAVVWVRSGGAVVQVVPVERTAIVQSVVATGRINAPARIDVAAEVSATVQRVSVREGDKVAAGAPLVQLSDAEARAALEQARASLAEAKARASQQASVTAPVSRQAVVQANAAYRAALREHQRAKKLVADGFFSQQKLDETRRMLDTAKSALDAAQVQSQANQPRGVERELAAARISQAEAAVQVAQARLDRLSIRAPVDAVVLTRNVEPGTMAQLGRTLLSLAAQGATRMDAAIDEKHLHMLSIGMAARALADAFPGRAFDGKLAYIAPAVDPQRGTVEVRVAVPNPPDFLRPDMTVSVELLGGQKDDALVLPAGAVRDADRGNPWVLAAQGGRAVKVPVTLGLRGVGSVEIASGLAEGELAIPQTEKALPGDRITPRLAAGEKNKGFEVPSFIRG